MAASSVIVECHLVNSDVDGDTTQQINVASLTPSRPAARHNPKLDWLRAREASCHHKNRMFIVQLVLEGQIGRRQFHENSGKQKFGRGEAWSLCESI